MYIYELKKLLYRAHSLLVVWNNREDRINETLSESVV